jgi:ubiquinone/menaquinone biosynthesis C-methylase UbiE
MRSSTDKDWEYFGKNDPYYGVFSLDKFRSSHVESNRAEFFQTGADWIEHVMNVIRSVKGPEWKPDRGLDFGCGVGRLLVPLASYCGSLTGIDVSPSILKECRKNLDARGLSAVRLEKADASLSAIKGNRFDLVHSVHVFQHIPTKKGLALYARLLDSVNPNGVAVLHLPFYRRASRLRKTVHQVRKEIPWLNGFVNLYQRKSFREPLMQMNVYPFSELMRLSAEKGFGRTLFETSIDDAGFYSGYMFLAK